MALDQREVEREGRGADEEHHEEDAARMRAQQEKRERPDEVVLLFDAERPEVQQRLQLRRGVEIPGLAPERDVGNESRACRDMLAELRKFIRQQHAPSQEKAAGEHQDECREDAPDAPPIEAGKGEAAPTQLVQDDAGDQESRDDEEHVHADEAARHHAGEGVIAEHREHGEGAQPVDVRSIGVRRARDHGGIFGNDGTMVSRRR